MLQRYNSCNNFSAQNSRGKKNQESTVNIFASQNNLGKHPDYYGKSMVNLCKSPMNMFGQSTNNMGGMFDDFGDMDHTVMRSRDQGGFTQVQRIFAMQRKVGQDNKVYEEKYVQNNVAKKDSSGNIKQEAYKNNLNKRDFIAQERTFNNKGRKLVQEKANGFQSSSNHFFNMDEDEIDQFDSKWDEYHGRQQPFQNSLSLVGYAGTKSKLNKFQDNDFNHDHYNWGQPFKYKGNRFSSQTQQQINKKGMLFDQDDIESDFSDYDDDERRGSFIPPIVKNQNQVVRLNNASNIFGRRSTNIQQDSKPSLPQQQNNRRQSAVQPARQPNQTQSQSNNNQTTSSQILQLLTRHSQTPAQNNRTIVNNSTTIRSNQQEPASQQNVIQQRETVSTQQRATNSQPVRNYVEPGIFQNINSVKDELPRAG